MHTDIFNHSSTADPGFRGQSASWPRDAAHFSDATTPDFTVLPKATAASDEDAERLRRTASHDSEETDALIDKPRAETWDHMLASVHTSPFRENGRMPRASWPTARSHADTGLVGLEFLRSFALSCREGHDTRQQQSSCDAQNAESDAEEDPIQRNALSLSSNGNGIHHVSPEACTRLRAGCSLPASPGSDELGSATKETGADSDVADDAEDDDEEHEKQEEDSLTTGIRVKRRARRHLSWKSSSRARRKRKKRVRFDANEENADEARQYVLSKSCGARLPVIATCLPVAPQAFETSTSQSTVAAAVVPTPVQDSHCESPVRDCCAANEVALVVGEHLGGQMMNERCGSKSSESLGCTSPQRGRNTLESLKGVTSPVLQRTSAVAVHVYGKTAHGMHEGARKVKRNASTTSAVSSVKYALHTIITTLTITAIGFLIGVLPLGSLARMTAESMARYTRNNLGSTISPVTWKEEDFEQIDRSAALVFYALFRFWNAMSVFMSMWFALALGWHGWKWAKTKPLRVMIAGVSVFFAYIFFFDILMAYKEVKVGVFLRVLLHLPAYAIGISTILLVVLVNPIQPWRQSFWLVFNAAISGAFGFIAITEAIRAYFRFQYTVTRLFVRAVLPATIKSVWIHVVFHAMLKLEAKYPKRKFLVLTQLLSLTTAAGCIMQVAAASVVEAVLMECLQVVFELSNYFTLLGGQTQVESTLHNFCDLSRKFCNNDRCRSLLRLADFVEAKLPKKPADFETDASYIERREMLAAAAACCAVIEASCLCLMFLQYLVLPLRPNDVAKEPVPCSEVAQLVAVSFVFEICISDVIAAYLSNRLAISRPLTYVDITKVWIDIGDFKTLAIMCVIIISCTMDILGRFLSALCPAAHPSSSTLMSLGRCSEFDYFD